jgi:hypothetical protein
MLIILITTNVLIILVHLQVIWMSSSIKKYLLLAYRPGCFFIWCVLDSWGGAYDFMYMGHIRNVLRDIQ